MNTLINFYIIKMSVLNEKMCKSVNNFWKRLFLKSVNKIEYNKILYNKYIKNKIIKQNVI